MALFQLQIVTPDRSLYDGPAERIIVRSVAGDVCIMAHHIDFVTPLGVGEARVTDENGNTRVAACNGGFLGVSGGAVRVMPISFEWADEIDLDRAQRAKEEAEINLSAARKEDIGYKVAEYKLKRAMIRIQVRENK